MDSPEKPDEGRTIAVNIEARPGRWEIAPGRFIDAYTYGGTVPGPLIEVRKGDSLAVRLTNRLPEPTTLHWHGLRLPAEVDGSELTQRPVAPDEVFEYRFTVPDGGTFWYHPHLNEAVQMEMGLYGVVVVRSEDELRFDAEKLLVFDNLNLDSEDRIVVLGEHEERQDGRPSSVLLLNGRIEPELHMSGGQTERWRLLNASSARYVLFSLGGQGFRVIASDGGLLTEPATADRILLAPGERLELAVGPFAGGDEIPVDGLPYDRGHGIRDGGRYALLRVGPPAATVVHIPGRLRDIAPLADAEASPNRVLRMTAHMSAGHVNFGFNDQMHYVDEPVRIGDLQVWKVVNETGMDHPFHLHGFFFQVLRADDLPARAPYWKDTVNVPARGSVTIAWLPDDRPGRWMYHCHILEHHAVGMMGHLDVVRSVHPR